MNVDSQTFLELVGHCCLFVFICTSVVNSPLTYLLATLSFIFCAFSLLLPQPVVLRNVHRQNILYIPGNVFDILSHCSAEKTYSATSNVWWPQIFFVVATLLIASLLLSSFLCTSKVCTYILLEFDPRILRVLSRRVSFSSRR